MVSNAKICLSAIAVFMALRALFMAVVPLTDPSETRYGAIAANMSRSGDFTVPRFIYKGEFQSFDGKPPLFFQMGGLACAVFGESEFAVRLPSLLAALGILALVYHTMRRLEGAEVALTAAVLCASGPVFYLFGGLCMTDMVLAFCIIGAICSYMMFAGTGGLPREQKAYSVAFFAFLGLGMLAKGPVAIMMSGLPVLVYVWAGKRWRELSRHAWVAGPLVFFAVMLPWYAKMTLQKPGFLEYFFVNENFLRFVTKDYGDRFGTGHNSFPGMALVWFAITNMTVLPVAIWMTATGRRLFAKGDFTQGPAPSLALAGVVCITGFWCLTSRSLLQYLLPTAPLFAIWIAVKTKDWGLHESPSATRNLKLYAITVCAVSLAGLGGTYVLGRMQIINTPKWTYREVMKIRGENPGYSDAYFYFMRNAPFSAEFYLGASGVHPDEAVYLCGMLRVHPDEEAVESAGNSKNDFLLMTRKNAEKHGVPPQRAEIFSNKRWMVFAPEPVPPDENREGGR